MPIKLDLHVHSQSRGILFMSAEQLSRRLRSTGLDGVAIPLHPGAEKFYKEAGLLK